MLKVMYDPILKIIPNPELILELGLVTKVV